MRRSESSGESGCAMQGCEKRVFRRGVCVTHYRSTLPRCQARGCARPAVAFKMCWPHRKLWGGPVRSPPRRSSTEQIRVLAWGRLYLATDAVQRGEEEARVRGGSPSGLLAEIIEAWARTAEPAPEPPGEPEATTQEQAAAAPPAPEGRPLC